MSRRPGGDGARSGGGRSLAPRALAAVVGLAGMAAWLLSGAPVGADPGLPWIVEVGAPRQMRVGTAATVSVAYRAPRGNVVAVVQEIEDLDGPPAARATRQREYSVVARAFGHERGQLVLPLSFASAGWKLVRLALVTDERQTGDPVSIEVEVLP